MSFWSSILGPRKGFEGGLFLPEYKTVTARLPIETLRVDAPLRVPLRAGRNLGTESVVTVGDRVRKGQRLSRPTTWDSVAVHAPTSGVVERFERVWTARDGFIPGVRLEPDGEDENEPPGCSTKTTLRRTPYLAWLLAPESFLYWTIMHITDGFVPR